jgi:hypothetical protein
MKNINDKFGKFGDPEEHTLDSTIKVLDAHLARVKALKKIFKGYDDSKSYNINLANSKK